MDIINMSSREITSNIELDYYNTSGELRIINYFNSKMVLKSIDSNGYDKVLFLDRYRDLMPSSFVIPKFLVFMDNRDLYMAMDYVKGNNLGAVLKDSNINICDKKRYLSYIGKILEKMRCIREKYLFSDFYLGDLHEDNFIVSNKKLYTIDLDGIKIDSANPVSYYLQGDLFSKFNCDKYNVILKKPYFVKYEVNYNTDLYCYIMIVLNFLYGGNVNDMDIWEFYCYLDYLDRLGIDSSLLECFNSIYLDGDNINPMNYIDSLTSNQIYRARKIVYKYNR